MIEIINIAHWKIWPGWEGNHDKRIEGATCSSCGYVHPTVRGSTDKLSDYCESCGSCMTVKETL